MEHLPHDSNSQRPLIAIQGDGVAARCCAHLLRKSGFSIAITRRDRARVPAIMLGEQSLALLRDVFENPALFADSPKITRRVVAWGDASPVHSVPHSAVVVSEKVLLETIGQDTGSQPETDRNPDFTIYTTGPLPPHIAEQTFGSRRATAARVLWKQTADPSSCWIESLPDGWLFLIPNTSDSTWLLAIGAPLETQLAASRLIAPLVEISSARSAEFSSCPRILKPVCGDNWLACGSVAMGFDPICGDGTAQAVREAILASAVIAGLANNMEKSALLSHYESMLTASMRRHLSLCADFYRTGGTGSWWQAELQSLLAGHAWCTARLAQAPEPQFQLNGFELLKREPVAG